ncbi:MAG: hypothetical protein ABSA77_13010 [Thermoguttaceae bacterium]|jgi:hypothetical protein
MLGKLIGLVLGAVFVGALVPTALTSIATANVSAGGAGVVALWGVIGIAIVAGVIFLILKEVDISF